jgi:predicted thioredoxin/glutaredoxin
LWNRQFPQVEGRTADQHDAWVVAEWLRAADIDGRLALALSPQLDASERSVAEIEGWILGVE